ncbi:MAG: CBS domain-containing protein [Acidimicrobiia bacterium]
MNISEILDAKGWDVATIEPDALVLRALHDMSARNFGALVVTNDGEHVLGVISDRDITLGLVRHGCDLLSLPVGDVMSTAVPVCRPDESTTSCMLTMTASRQRHLPVTVNGVLCGLVSIGDIVKHRIEELELRCWAW